MSYNLKLCSKCGNVVSCNCNLDKYVCDNCGEIEEAIDVEMSNMVHGHWIDSVMLKNYPTVKCSVCGTQFCDMINNHKYMYRFCPYCGKIMDECDEYKE